MNNHFLVGILAGLASALLASPLVVTALLPASIFIYFSPLPILIVSLCWRHQAGLVATFVSALALLLPNFDLNAGLFMLIGIGLPAWGLAYLLLLGRKTDSGMEWYPLGNILIWIVGVASLFCAIALLIISGASYERYMAYVQTLLNAYEPLLKEILQDSYDRDTYTALFRASLPVGLSSLYTLLFIFNLWISAKISTRLKRMPRPPLFIPAARMPPVIIGVTFIGIALVFLDGFPGLIGMGIRGSAYTALFFQGMVFIHFVTLGHGYRTLMLTLLYLVLLLTMGMGIVTYVVIGLGVADILFNIRKKFGANGSPPANTSTKSF